jgi:hypothetical protein
MPPKIPSTVLWSIYLPLCGAYGKVVNLLSPLGDESQLRFGGICYACVKKPPHSEEVLLSDTRWAV